MDDFNELSDDEIRALLEGLGAREQQVLWHMCRGAKRKQIAEALTIDSDTVKSHKQHIYRKLGLRAFSAEQRVRLLRDIFCSVMAGNPPQRSQPDTANLEPVDDPELDRIIEEDERALTLYRGLKKLDNRALTRVNPGPIVLPPRPEPPIRGIARTTIAALLIAVVALVAWSLNQGATQLVPIIQTQVVRQTQIVRFPVTQTVEVTVLGPTQIVEVPVEVIKEVTPLPPTPTSTPPFALPFEDTFADTLRPEWRLTQGIPIFTNQTLSPAPNSPAIMLELDTSNIPDYVLSFDVTNLGQGGMLISFRKDVRLRLYLLLGVSAVDALIWQVFVNNNWTNHLEEGYAGPREQYTVNLRVVGNKPQMTKGSFTSIPFSFGSTEPHRLQIIIEPETVIDNVRITLP